MRTALARAGGTRVTGLLLIVALLGVWEVAVRSGRVASVSVPAFSRVVVRWWELMLDGTLVTQFAATFWRMLLGYAAAAIVGIVLGLLMGHFRAVYNLFEPITEVLRPMPSPAYIPLVILFLGVQDSMKIFVIFLGCLWPIVLNAVGGVGSVQPVQVNTARTFGLGRWKTLKSVIVPAAAPSVFTGLRISLGLALILAIIAEMVASNDGIGHFILFSQRSFRVENMYAGVITLGMVGYLLNYLFIAMEKKVLHWHHGAMRKS